LPPRLGVRLLNELDKRRACPDCTRRSTRSRNFQRADHKNGSERAGCPHCSWTRVLLGSCLRGPCGCCLCNLASRAEYCEAPASDLDWILRTAARLLVHIPSRRLPVCSPSVPNAGADRTTPAPRQPKGPLVNPWQRLVNQFHLRVRVSWQACAVAAGLLGAATANAFLHEYKEDLRGNRD
jgi:hypothetical protein